MKNTFVNVKCPSCRSSIQMKAKSLRSDVFYCPVCGMGEIESPDASMIINVQKMRLPLRQPVLARI